MQEIWDRIKEGLSIHAPGIIPHLQAGASEEEIRSTEKKLGIKFPEDVRASYRIHNGMSGDRGFICSCSEYCWSEFYSLENIFRAWDIWRDLLEAGEFDNFQSEPNGPIKTDWWNIKWIPLLGNSGGDHCCIDLDPPSEGKLGQIITMWHETGAEELLAPSFKDFLTNFAEELNAGVYTYSEDDGGLISVTELEEDNAKKKENERQLAQFKKQYAGNPQALEADLRKQMSRGGSRELSEMEESVLKALTDWSANSGE